MRREIGKADFDLDQMKSQEAIEIYLRWLPEIVRNGWLSTEAKLRINLGYAYQGLGDMESAAVHQARALEVFRLLGDEVGVADALTNFAPLLRQMGDFSRAKSGLEEALQIASRRGDRASMIRIRAQLASTSAALGDLNEGLEQVRKALTLSSNNREEAPLLMLLGSLSWQAGDYAGAIENASRASELGLKEGDLWSVFGGQVVLAMSFGVLGDFDRAYDHLSNAIGFVEVQGLDVSAGELKSLFMDRNFDLYAGAVLLAAETGRPLTAFKHAEQAKARAFLDEIWQPRLGRSGAEPRLLARLQEISRRRGSLLARIQEEKRKPLSVKDESVLDKLGADLDKLQTEQEDLFVGQKLTSHARSSLIGAYSGEIDDVERLLDDQTTLVEYFATERPDRKDGLIYAWVIRKKSLALFRLSSPVSEIAQKITLLNQLIAERRESRLVAAELHQKLFAPLESHIRGRKLIIVPHGVLHQLPFAVLRNAKRRRHLLDDYTLSYAPSASVLHAIYSRGQAENRGVLVLGNPDGSLPHAAREAEAIARLYGVQPLLGPKATESAVARSHGFGILHLAAHGVYDSAHPLFSHIDLAAEGVSDGRLEVHEIVNLDLQGTSLVVLSSCRVQAKEVSAGDELAGLPRAFLLAGAQSVVSSLWNVDDESTGALMKQFYRYLRKGIGRADALRRAQIETRARIPDPYNWAAFTLTGMAD